MPTVRRFQRSIQPAPLPGVRRTSALTREAAGVQVALAEGERDATAAMGEAQVHAGRAGIAATLGREQLAFYAQVQEQAYREANTTAFLEATNKTNVSTESFLTDPKTGVFVTHRGKNASELLSIALGEYDRLAGEAAATLTPSQRVAYERWQARDRQQYALRVSTFVTREQEEHAEKTAAASVGLSLNDAVRNVGSPKAFYGHLADAVAVIQKRGDDLGRDPAVVRAQVLEATTFAHTQAIDGLIDAGQVTVAKKWLASAELGGQIQQDKANNLRDKIQGASATKQGQMLGDKAQAEGKTLTERMELIRRWTAEIDDPDGKVRSQAEETVRSYHSVAQQERLDYDRDTLRSGYDIINKTGTWTKIPATVLHDPKNAELVGHWKAYARQQRDAAQPDRYGPEYLSLVRLSALNPDKFKDANLESVRYRMTREEFGALNELQADIIRGNAKGAAEKVPTIGQFEKTFELVLGQAGYDSLAIGGSDKASKAKKDEVFKIRQSVARQMDIWTRPMQDPVTKEWIRGKAVTDADVQRFIGVALSERILAEQDRWFGPDKTYEKPMIQMTIGDVPKAARKQIEAGLKEELGMDGPFPDAVILNRYLTSYGSRKGQ